MGKILQYERKNWRWFKSVNYLYFWPRYGWPIIATIYNNSTIDWFNYSLKKQRLILLHHEYHIVLQFIYCCIVLPSKRFYFLEKLEFFFKYYYQMKEQTHTSTLFSFEEKKNGNVCPNFYLFQPGEWIDKYKIVHFL
jgi:hypothetical protein